MGDLLRIDTTRERLEVAFEATLKNFGPDTLSYANAGSATLSSSLPAGASVVVAGSVDMASAGRSRVFVTQASDLSDDDRLDVIESHLSVSHADVTSSVFGAVADAVQTTGSITSGQNTLTISGGFSPTDVGKVVFVGGAGATADLGATNGGTAVPRPLRGWISSVSASGVASLVTAKGGSTVMNATTTQSGTTVTYGTNLYDGLVAALATGLPVEIPAGDYILSGTVTAVPERVFGHGHATRIFVSNDFTTFSPTNGTGRTGSTRALSGNATAGDLSIGLASVTGISQGDILALTSTATWESSGLDSDGTFTTKGEFVRVQQIQGTTVYLESQLADSYATADTAQVQLFSFAEGIDVADLRFVNATPNVVTYAASTPMALSQYDGGGSVFQILRYRDVKFSNVEFEKCGGAHIFMANCIDFTIHRFRQKDGAQLGAFGYGVSLFGCQWGEMSNSVGRRSSSLINTEGFLSSNSAQAVMPTRWVTVRDCTSFEGTHEPFLCHLTSEAIDFIDCRIFGGSFYPKETTHSPGFRIGGRRCKLIRPIIERHTGTAILIAGKYCEVHDPIIRNLVPDGLSMSRGIHLYPTNPGALNTVIRNADFDTITQTAANTEGHGIVIDDGVEGTRIVGRNEMRNLGGYGVWDKDDSDTTVIDGLVGVNHGATGSSFTPYLIKRDDATVPTPAPYRNLVATFLNTSARYCDQATAVHTRYAKITATGTFVVPDGVCKVKARLCGGGGGGGGGGSAVGATLQAGGGGGAAGQIIDGEFIVVGGETLTVTIGAGGSAGAGGAANGNAGSDGGAGGATTLQNGGSVTLGTTPGGVKGRGSGANTTTAAGGGLYGSNANASSNVNWPGSGAGSATSSPGPVLAVVGGAGGGNATATLGGGAGGAQAAASYPAVQTTGSASGTSAGVNGQTAAQPGCGGGGGGAGAAGTGAGGNGGAGADGFVEIWW